MNREIEFIGNIRENPELLKKNDTHWMIDTSILEPVREIAGAPYEIDKEIGNCFETKEDAERAVEKLKALKRLRDKGLKFVGWQDSVSDNNPDMVLFRLDEDGWEEDACNDLDLLFGEG